MNLYLVRHGETEFNVRGVYYGWTDCDINDNGIHQAEALSKFFCDIDYGIIISSTLKRAIHTGEIIKGSKPVPFIRDYSLKEFNFGDWEDKSFSDIENNDAENCKIWYNDWKNFRVPNGESFLEFYERVSKGIDKILHEHEGKNILIVAHSGTISSILCHLIGVGFNGFWKFKALHKSYSLLTINDGNVTVERINSSLE